MVDGEVQDSSDLQFQFRYGDTGWRIVSGRLVRSGSVVEPANGSLAVGFHGGGSELLRISLVRVAL